VKTMDNDCAHNPYRLKGILWSSNPYDPSDFYADKLELWEHETDFDLVYQFKVGGSVTTKPVVRKMEKL
jgi:hypothetical protein